MKLNSLAALYVVQRMEKHAALLRAAKLVEGYVSVGRVVEQEAVRELFREICKRDIDSEDAAVDHPPSHGGGKQTLIEKSSTTNKMRSVSCSSTTETCPSSHQMTKTSGGLTTMPTASTCRSDTEMPS